MKEKGDTENILVAFVPNSNPRRNVIGVCVHCLDVLVGWDKERMEFYATKEPCAPGWKIVVLWDPCLNHACQNFTDRYDTRQEAVAAVETILRSVDLKIRKSKPLRVPVQKALPFRRVSYEWNIVTDRLEKITRGPGRAVLSTEPFTY